MQAQFKTPWKNLEDQKHLFEKRISATNDLQFDFKPTPEEWSMLQVLQHLVAIERISTNYLVQKGLSKKRGKGGFKSYIRSIFLKLMLKSPLKFKVPAVKGLQGLQDLKKQELLNEWDQVRIELQSFLDRFPKSRNQEVIFRHPLVGWLTMEQTLIFFCRPYCSSSKTAFPDQKFARFS